MGVYYAGYSARDRIDGSLYRGGTNTAGQFGPIPLDLSGPECRCGLRGCWDLYASVNATVAMSAVHVFQFIAT